MAVKTLVIGATGYIGSAVAEALAARGHEVLALSRSGKPGRYGLRSGDLADPASLREAAADVEVVVHAAPPLGDEQADTAAITALLESGARLVYTSGVWVLGASGAAVLDETVSTAALAAAADQAAGGPGNAQPWPTAADTVGEPFAQALALDQAVTSTQTRTTLGWTPHHPTALADLTTGSY
ncbi:hypothetical protein SUDANB95_04675 [Actinosynnema sp. ALI-1.44]